MAAETLTFDYIIVGGGLCGCVLASRLKQGDPSVKILLIEAGPDSNDNPLTSAPSNVFISPQTEIDWSYSTVPQKHLNNRSYHLRAGKILTGGIALNGFMGVKSIMITGLQS